MPSEAETLLPASDTSADISFDDKDTVYYDKENKRMEGGDRMEEADSQNSTEEEEGGAQGKPQEPDSHDRNVSLEVDDEDSDEFDMGFIRIRSHGIFEPEDEEDDDEFDEFPILPEVELTIPQSRKRKQEISFRNNSNGAEEIIVIQDEDDEFSSTSAPSYTLDPDLFGMGTRRRDRMPLYLLNPEDYAHDPKKQIQIRRAIITYRHHQDKKEQIIKLTEENRMLRAHMEDLRSKVEELAVCGCDKNRLVSLEILDVKIPVVPPRMYVRGNRPMLGVPYNKCSLPPPSTLSFSNVKSELESSHGGGYPSTNTTSSLGSKPVAVDVHKPLINIGTSRLNLITSNTLKSVNSGVKPVCINPGSIMATHVSRTNFNGNPAATASGSIFQRPSSRFLQPGVTNVQISGGTIRPGLGAGSTPATIPITANVKVEGTTPATACTASKLLFGSKVGGNNGPASGTAPTASQLLFGAKLSQNHIVEPSSTTLTASQLAMANRLQQNRSAQLGSAGQSQPSAAAAAGAAGQVFRTASGQVLKLVQQPPSTNRQPVGPVRATKGLTPVQPIAPRPGPARDNAPYEMPKRPFEKKDVEELWKKFDDDDDDELAIIAAINGTAPPPKVRKQNMSSRSNEQGEADGRELLNKYRDIVFEEAD